MDARPFLVELAQALDEHGLEAVLIGSAAALQGAPVTTIDFDFFFRKTPRNVVKLKAVARSLRSVILRPYYPASGLFRLVRDEDGLQADFMATIHGVRSFAGLRSRAAPIEFAGHRMLAGEFGRQHPEQARGGAPAGPCGAGNPGENAE